VLLAVSIFSIALLLFSAYFVNSFTISKSSDRELVAMNLARQIAEQYKNKDYEDLNDEIDSEKTPQSIELNGTTYIVKVSTEKLSLEKPQKISENESIIRKSPENSIEGQNAPILITIHINIEGLSHPLATMHTMVVYPERNH